MGQKIHVFDSFHIQHKNQQVTILETGLFQDNEITLTIRSNIGIHTEFQVEKQTHCFSEPTTRFIGFWGKEDYSSIVEFEFV